jgi:energy-coupling factor transporter ATP-binding protein EcfA2
MLDSTSRKQVLEAVLALHQQGTSVIWLTHHMEELAAADRVVGLDDGSVVFDGTPVSYFYGSDLLAESTPCELLGFIPPYPVQVARELIRLGTPLHSLPLSAAQLAEAVVKHA